MEGGKYVDLPLISCICAFLDARLGFGGGYGFCVVSADGGPNSIPSLLCCGVVLWARESGVANYVFLGNEMNYVHGVPQVLTLGGMPQVHETHFCQREKMSRHCQIYHVHWFVVCRTLRDDSVLNQQCMCTCCVLFVLCS